MGEIAYMPSCMHQKIVEMNRQAAIVASLCNADNPLLLPTRLGFDVSYVVFMYDQYIRPFDIIANNITI